MPCTECSCTLKKQELKDAGVGTFEKCRREACKHDLGSHNDADATAPTDDLTTDMKAMRLDLHAMRESLPSVVVGFTVTPTSASRNPDQANSVLEALRLNAKPAASSDLVVKAPATWKFKWSWVENKEPKPEKSSYLPVQAFLQECKLPSLVVADGSHLTNKLLFKQEIFNMRLEDPTTAPGQLVYRKHKVQGRVDVVVLNEELPQGCSVLRHNVLFGIEIKTPQDMEKSTSSCVREVQMQVIGLNADNANNSPPMVLTNLVKKHSVLYLAHKMGSYGYEIRQLHCSSFPEAVAAARQIANRPCLTANFSRPSTPTSSLAEGSEDEAEGEGDEGDAEGDDKEPLVEAAS